MPVVEFKQPDYDAPEEAGGVEVCVALITTITQPLTIEVQVTDKPASTNPAGLVIIYVAAYTGNHCIIPSTEAEDFVAETVTLTFQPGEDCVCFNTTVINDDIALEGDEQFRVIFSELNGATVGDIDEACVTIPEVDGMYD